MKSFVGLLVITYLALVSATPIPGLDLVGVGMDILSGKTKLPVVQFSYNKQASWYNPFLNQSFDSPDQAVVYVTSETDIDVGVYWSVADYAAAYADAYEVDESYYDYAYTQSDAVAQAYAVFYGGESILSVTEAEISLYEVICYPTSTLSTSDLFTSMVEKLPTEYDEKAYGKMVKSFGTHVVIQAAFGGEALMYATVANELYVEAGVQAVQSAALAYFQQSTGFAFYGAESAQEEVVDEGYLQSYFAFAGGLYEQVDVYSDWMKTIKYAPSRISYKLAELSEMVSHPQKKVHLQKAVMDHVTAAKKLKQN